MEHPIRHLYVLRHAKSSWEDPGQPDHDRPLAPRGRNAVKLLAEHIAHERIRPELVLCSTARRARETLDAVAPGGEVRFEPDLYTAGCGELISRLRGLPPNLESVMVIGHNPIAQMLVLKLAHDESDHLPDIRRKFPTGALATLELECAWADLAPACAELAAYVRPKSLHLYQ